MNETEGLLINTTYENPHFIENAKKINFMYDEIGCYYFQFLLSQENYKTEKNIQKKICSSLNIITNKRMYHSRFKYKIKKNK